ncbi:unnamed protein product [Camellia sinensis]
MTEMLSELFLPKAISVRLSATACAAGISSSIMHLRRLLKRRLATSPTSSFDMTSQRPSLANIRHSSSSLLVVEEISGTGLLLFNMDRSHKEVLIYFSAALKKAKKHTLPVFYIGERAVDYGVHKLWEYNNVGKRYEDIPVLGQRPAE